MHVFLKYLSPIVAIFFAVALGVGAATVIGTDIETEGAITADGTITAATLTAPFVLADALQLSPIGEEFEAPVCAVGTDGTLVYRTQTGVLCVCNGTDYVQVASTTQTCPWLE